MAVRLEHLLLSRHYFGLTGYLRWSLILLFMILRQA